MVRLILTDSYFSLFPILNTVLGEKVKGIEGKNVVFCEEKVSLMAERTICACYKGSFNTEVYSFGNFLRVKKPIENLLTKEGSAMAVKKILSDVSLSCFKASKTTLAPALYELIMQLKSAKISPEDIKTASVYSKGILKNKLEDVEKVYTAYEKYIKENGFEDQSSSLSYLPSVIRGDSGVNGANVFLVGFDGWTKQIKNAIDALLDCAKNVTAILVQGENPLVYVNETANYFRTICKDKGVLLQETRCDSGFCENGKLIVDNLYRPKKTSQNAVLKNCADKIVTGAFSSPLEEITRIAETIKSFVIKGEYRYRDFTIALGDTALYSDFVKGVFDELAIPYFFDEQKRADEHPLVGLIISYIDCFNKNLEAKTLAKFYKNPLFEQDKGLTDDFENYLLKYNVNYGKIKDPFTFESDAERFSDFESLRKRTVGLFERFDVQKMLNELNVKDKLDIFTEKLEQANASVEASVNSLIYDAVMGILHEMRQMLGETKLTLLEFKNIFLSGVTALKLSPLPQFNDAVFIGGFKETAQARAKVLFVAGLTSEVPAVQADVSLLSDDDINSLQTIEVLVEPKIRVVNHRAREALAMAIVAFSEKLYLSYPVSGINGKKNTKSEVFACIEGLFSTGKFPQFNGYLTKSQATNTFAKACGDFVDGKINDITEAVSFYNAYSDEKLKSILDLSNKEVVERLNCDNKSYIGEVTSPTTIEDYYKCPYYAFVSHGLNIKEREEGEVNTLSVGNVMHEILRKYVFSIDKVSDIQSSNALFESIKEELLSSKEYKKFLSQSGSKSTLFRVLEECKKYCYKTYLSIRDSEFNNFQTEVAFGDNKFFPAIELNGGKVKIKGKIDRVDYNDNYYRVIDYKTGKVDVSDKGLFSGTKLQLYLYSLAVQSKFGNKKAPAGLYYLPINDKFEKPDKKEETLALGKTLGDENAILVQDKNFLSTGESKIIKAKIEINNKDDKKGQEKKLKNTVDKKVFDAYVKYALSLCELAVQNILDGVIKVSPYKGACEYCEYSALCGGVLGEERVLGKVTEKTIINAVEGGKE